ncbi:MAG: o-succinylbenzoate--CoA ligase [Candidatus Hydrogenedentes bacterium]|nr:o-succinylbenzoate--CoA ligase [Candidatus Hydrogenedentota bacterium]
MIESSWPLTRAALKYGDAPALLGDPISYSYRDYDARTRSIAAALSAAGIGHGDRIGVLALPSTHLAPLLMGCFQLGAVACIVNTRIPRHGIAEHLHRVSAMALLVDEFFAIVRLDHMPTLRIEDLVASDHDGHPLSRSFRLDQDATILFTSGSSDEPKAALHTLSNHCYSAVASNQNIALGPGDRWLLSLPLYHVSGLGILFRCLFGGAAVVVPEVGESIESTINRFGVTHASLVATQLFRMLQSTAGVTALQRLKAILVGGSAVSSSLLRQAHEQGLRVYTTYGLTETASQMTTTPPGATFDDLLTSGRPLKPDTVSISSGGEILVRGSTLFRGYVEPDGITLPMTANGWLATGDLGRFDERDNLIVSGRKDNLVVTGGENVQPEEIEKCLGTLSGVLQAVVVAIEDAEFGARLVAFVKTDGNTHLLQSAMQLHLERHLPKYKVPFTFLPWPDEADANVKVNRTMLKGIAKHKAIE